MVWPMIRSQRLKSTFIVPLLISLTLWAFNEPLQAQNTAYRIGPRDVLTLTICAGGQVQQTTHLTVSSQGTINVPFIIKNDHFKEHSYFVFQGKEC